MAIRSFAGREAEEFFVTGRLRKGVGWSAVSPVAARKLDMLDYAERLTDLLSPPGNRLEALYGDRKGFHSIRINERWRVVFRWTKDGPADVEIVDYH